mmetsp:Transcript_24891/g.69877  ORF Transcript_24891/g.69877 Transcript_24891/m.69877 type:complete len:218 (-) Transcript_24891:411-1064(-)
MMSLTYMGHPVAWKVPKNTHRSSPVLKVTMMASDAYTLWIRMRSARSGTRLVSCRLVSVRYQYMAMLSGVSMAAMPHTHASTMSAAVGSTPTSGHKPCAITFGLSCRNTHAALQPSSSKMAGSRYRRAKRPTRMCSSLQPRLSLRTSATSSMAVAAHMNSRGTWSISILLFCLGCMHDPVHGFLSGRYMRKGTTPATVTASMQVANRRVDSRGASWL